MKPRPPVTRIWLSEGILRNSSSILSNKSPRSVAGVSTATGDSSSDGVLASERRRLSDLEEGIDVGTNIVIIEQAANAWSAVLPKAKR